MSEERRRCPFIHPIQSTMTTMKNSEKVFRAHRAIAWFYGVLGFAFAWIPLYGGSQDAMEWTVWSVVVFGTIFAAHYFTARACKAEKKGGRLASIVIACLLLMAFPVGTLIGIYLLSNTWHPWPEAQSAVGPVHE